jgi:uncharacterized protein
MMSTPKTKIALITGGSSGIGFAIAVEFAKRGNNILLVSNQESELLKCKHEIERQYKVLCDTFAIDLANQNAAAEVFDYCLQQSFEVDVLVNNAGILVFSEVVNTSIERVNTILQLHMITPTLLCNLFGAKMKERRRGFIMNVSSISSVMPYPGISLYGPSKTYMRYFTRAFRSEMNAVGVNVSCLIPGATVTALYDPNRVNLSLALRLGVMQQPDFVAEKAVEALYTNKAECIPGLLNKITVALMPVIPQWIIALMYRKSSLFDQGKYALN